MPNKRGARRTQRGIWPRGSVTEASKHQERGTTDGKQESKDQTECIICSKINKQKKERLTQIICCA